LLSITFIGSGSDGNSALLRVNQSSFLLDAGLSCKKITDFLKSEGLNLEDLEGILLTHEHSDHIKGLKTLLKKAPELPVYASLGTYDSLADKGIEIESFCCVSDEHSYRIADFWVYPFETPHDAAEPLGFRVEGRSGTIAVATDLGKLTDKVFRYVEDSDMLCIESNYDEDMLTTCDYPYWLKNRIRSSSGHLPNGEAGKLLERMNKLPSELILVHVSRNSNREDLVLDAMRDFTSEYQEASSKMRISVAKQDEPLPVSLNLPLSV